jgi:hypothetical protein
MGVPSVAAAHERGAKRVVSVPKCVRSAHTQEALTGARTTPSERADANGRKEHEPRRSRSSVSAWARARHLSCECITTCTVQVLGASHLDGSS